MPISQRRYVVSFKKQSSLHHYTLLDLFAMSCHYYLINNWAAAKNGCYTDFDLRHPKSNHFGIKSVRMFGPLLKKFALKNFPVILWRNGQSDIYTIWKHRLRLPDCSNSHSGAYKSIPLPHCECIMTAGQNRTLVLELHLRSQQKVRLSPPTRVIWERFLFWSHKRESREFETNRCLLSAYVGGENSPLCAW